MIDVDAEKGVISSLFKGGKNAYIDIGDVVSTANSFACETFQVAYSVISNYFDRQDAPETIDIPSFLSHANSLGFQKFFSNNKEKAELKTATSCDVDISLARGLAAKIRKLYIGRLYHNNLGDAQKLISKMTGNESVSEIMAMAENKLFDLSAALNTSNAEEKIFDNIDEYLKYLEDNPVQQIGLPTPYRIWDRSIGGGLRRKTVNVIGARAKVGKSAHADNVAMFTAMNKVPVLMCDTEMNPNDHRNRILAMLSGVPIFEIETGQFASSLVKKNRLREAAEKLKGMPYTYKNIAGRPFEETLAEMRRWIVKDVGYANGTTKDCLIIFDYIKMMSADSLKNLEEFQALGFLMTGLHNFTVKYDVPCLSYVQLNRDGINREDTDVVSGSDRIVWLCSNLSILKKQSDEEIAAQAGRRPVFNRKLVTLVSRHGGGMEDGDYLNLRFDGDIARLTEGPLRSEFVAEPQNNSGFVVEEGDDTEPTVF